MKKLLFLLAFTFIGQQVFSQMYIVSVLSYSEFDTLGCNSDDVVLVIVDPTGNQTTTCIKDKVEKGFLISLNQELNNIVALGYKLIETSYPEDEDISGGQQGGSLINGNGSANEGSVFIFAIP